MSSRTYFRLLVLTIFVSYYNTLINAQDNSKLYVPSKYFAPVGETAKLPCLASSKKDALVWFSKSEEATLRLRSRTEVNRENPALVIRVIDNVQLKDAGNFICSDGKVNRTLQLIVINASEPLDVTAKFTKKNEALIKWKPPKNHPNHVKGYRIYVSTPLKTFLFDDVKTKVNKPGEFVLEDLQPNTKYEIQVAATFMNGSPERSSFFYGPLSNKVTLSSKQEDQMLSNTEKKKRKVQDEKRPVPEAPSKVEALPGLNSTILVRWQPPRANFPGQEFDFRVYFEGQTKVNPKSGSVLISSPSEEGLWEAVLEGLPIKIKYKIEVAAVTKGPGAITGHRSKPIMFQHDGFTPEMSLNAVALAPDTVLVTLSTVGDAVVDILRLLYCDDQAVEWRRVPDYNERERYAFVTGLKPNSQYFFMAKARVSGRPRQTITHVTTPSAVAAISSPTNVTVTAKSASDGTLLLRWATSGKDKPKGHIVYVQKINERNQSEPFQQIAVVNKNEAVIGNLSPRQKYQVQVIPFTGENRGACSDTVQFHLEPSLTEITTPTVPSIPAFTTPAITRRAPRFLVVPPEVITVKYGQEVKVDCAAVGMPQPAIQWYLNNEPFGESAFGRNEMTIDSATDTVEILCVAQNTEGVREQKAVIKVTRPSTPAAIMQPTFVDDHPENLNVNKGDNVKVVCAATGTPPPTVQWFYKGEPVSLATERRVEYAIPRISVAMELECRAFNVHGNSTKKVFVEVPADNSGSHKPFILSRLPETLEIDRGDDVEITCQAWGEPMPQIMWRKTGTNISKRDKRLVTYQENNVQESFSLYCTAWNQPGRDDKRVEVIVKEPKKYPVLITKIPRHIEKYFGESLTISCEFKGNPTPMVVWYNDSVPLTMAKPSSNTLVLPFVSAPSLLRCRGENEAGMGEEIVMLDIRYKSTPKPATTTTSRTRPTTTIRPTASLTHDVRLESKMVSPDVIEVKWVVDKGSIKDIGLFHVITYHRGNVVMTQSIGSNRRSFNLKSVNPGERYLVVVETLGEHNSLLANSSIDIVATPYETPRRPGLALELNEIRDNSFKYQIMPLALDHYGYNYRVQIDELQPSGNTRSLTNQLLPEAPLLTVVEGLKPRSKYQISVELLTKTNRPLMRVIQVLETAERGGYRDPIVLIHYLDTTPTTHASTTPLTYTTEASKAPITTTAATEATKVTMLTSTITPEVTIIVTTPSSEETSSPETSSLLTKPTTTEEAMDETYNVTSKTRFKAPNNAVIIWQVDQGNLEAIRHFNVTLFDSKGRSLIESKMAGNQRYINIHPLPNGNYVVNLVANGDTGELFQHNISVIVPPKSMDDEPRTPKLELEATEVRSTNVNLVWDVSNTDPKTIQSYRVKVYEDGPGGYNVMTKTMNANTGTLRITNLSPKKQYHVVVDALSPDNKVNMTSAVTFETPPPNKYGKPVKGVMQTPPGPEEEELPQMDMAITEDTEGRGQTGDDQSLVHKMYWNLKNVDEDLIMGFVFIVRLHGPEGAVMLNETLGPTIRKYELTGMLPDSEYFMELNAMSKADIPFMRIVTHYVPRKSPDPMKVFTKDLIYSGTPHPTVEEVPEKTDHQLNLTITEHYEEKDGIKVIYHSLNWTLTNLEGVAAYYLTVTEGDNIIAHVNLAPTASNYTLHQMNLDSEYNIRLSAASTHQSPIISVSTYYTPRKSRSPLTVFSRDDIFSSTPQPSGTGSEEPQMDMTVTEDKKDGQSPVHTINLTLKNIKDVTGYILRIKENSPDESELPQMDLTVTEEQISGQPSIHIIKWTLKNVVGLAGYAIRVKRDGPDGEVIIKEDLTPVMEAYTTSKLRPDSTYFLEFEALAVNLLPVLRIVTHYRPQNSSNPLKLSTKDLIFADIAPSSDIVPLHPQLTMAIRKSDRINVDGQRTFHDIIWSLTNVPEGLVTGYLLTIRNEGPRGDVLLKETHPHSVHLYQLEGMEHGKPYYLVLVSIANRKFPYQRVNMTYIPGQSPDPNSVSTTYEITPPKILLGIDVTPLGINGTLVNWNMTEMGTPGSVFKFVLKVQEKDENGDEVTTQSFSSDQYEAMLTMLETNFSYYFIIEAYDAEGFLLASDNITYTLPNISGPETTTEMIVEMKDPQLDIFIKKSNKLNPDGQKTFHDITWSLTNVPEGLVTGYLLTIRNEGPRGDVLLMETQPYSVHLYQLEGMEHGKLYFVELIAMSQLKLPLLRVVGYYTPGISPDPMSVSTTTLLKPPPKPMDISIDVVSLGYNGTLVNWTVTDSGQPGLSFVLKVLENDKNGDIVAIQNFTAAQYDVILTTLETNFPYYFIIEAYGAGDILLASDNMTYTLPFFTGPETTTEMIAPLELELSFKSLKYDGTFMYWDVHNDHHSRPIHQFRIQALLANETDEIMFSALVKGDDRNLTVTTLEANTEYDLILEALDANNNVLANYKVTYRVPFPEEEESLGSVQHTESQPDEEVVIYMEIVPMGTVVNFSWALGSREQQNEISKYIFSISVENFNGENVLRREISSISSYITVDVLDKKRLYFVMLDAFDHRQHMIASVQTKYSIPASGEVVRASSKGATMATLTPNYHDLTITKLEALNSTAVFISWYDKKSPDGRPSVPAVLGYAAYIDNTRKGEFRNVTLPEGIVNTLIQNLEPGTRYGFYVAPVNLQDPVTLESLIKFVYTNTLQ